MVSYVTSNNESAVSFSWLASKLDLATSDPSSPVQTAWNEILEQMRRRRDQVFIYGQDWLSDHWLARSSRVVDSFLSPTWEPPDKLDEWPTLGVNTALEGSTFDAK